MNKYFAGLFSLLLTTQVYAGPTLDLGTTYISLTNNTPYPLSINSQQLSQKKLSAEYWGIESTEVAPYQTKRILWFSRLLGVEPNRNYLFDAAVQSKNSTVHLQQQLHGEFLQTSVTHRTLTNDTPTPWYHDKAIHAQTAEFENHTIRLAQRAVDTLRGYSDINYVFEETVEKPQLSDNQNTLDVLSYNIWMMPVWLSKYEPERGKSLPKVLSGYDVVFLAEGFVKEVNQYLFKQLEHDYPYRTQVVAKDSLINGGVLIFSRWPIEHEAEHIYQARNPEKFDVLANKGVKYAIVNKNGQRYHLFATHTHAWANEKSKQVRWQQLLELKKFIEAQHIPNDQPVILGGDLNIDIHEIPDNSEYGNLLNLLNLREPTFVGHPFSFDPKYNALAGQSEPRQRLDYVFTLANYKPNSINTNQVRLEHGSDKNLWHIWDYSDHYPVWAHLEY